MIAGSANTSVSLHLVFPLDAARFSDFLLENTIVISRAGQDREKDVTHTVCVTSLTIDVLLTNADVGSYGQLLLEQPMSLTVGVQQSETSEPNEITPISPILPIGTSCGAHNHVSVYLYIVDVIIIMGMYTLW